MYRYWTKLLRAALWPCIVVVLGMGLVFWSARAGEDSSARTIAVRLIVVESPRDAENILQRLNKGNDFAVLAREESVDATAVNGGFMGKLDPETLRPELRYALRGVPPGQLSHVVKVPSGYAILKVLPESEAAQLENTDRNRLAAMSAEGSVRYSPFVDGLDEVLAGLARLPKPGGWDQDPRAICEAHTRAYATVRALLEQALDPNYEKSIVRNRKPLDVTQAYVALGQLHAYQGEMAQAIEQWEAAYRIAQSAAPLAVPQWMKCSELVTCTNPRWRTTSIGLPATGAFFRCVRRARYMQTANSEKAIQHFINYLERKPDDLGVKWLLTLAYMTSVSTRPAFPKSTCCRLPRLYPPRA